MIAGQTGIEFLRRHTPQDWVELSDEDVRENELLLKEGFRLLNAYRTAKGQRLWIVTEADRSADAAVAKRVLTARVRVPWAFSLKMGKVTVLSCAGVKGPRPQRDG